MDKLKKLIIILSVYAIIMRILWNHLSVSIQVNEVLLVLFAVTIIIFTMIFEMHKISKNEDDDEND